MAFGLGVLAQPAIVITDKIKTAIFFISYLSVVVSILFDFYVKTTVIIITQRLFNRLAATGVE